MTKLQTSTLRPGLLVSFNTSITGNVKYDKLDLNDEREGDVEISEWQTKRTINDRKEFEAAKKAISKAKSLVRGVCAQSVFGLLCPEKDADVLNDRLEQANEIVAEFNSKAKITRLHIFCMTGRVAADDVEAIKKINSEVRNLMSDMERGLKNLDVDTVRKAAQRAKNVGQMLTPDAEGRVVKAVELARKAASNIVKTGEKATVEIDKVAIRKIAEQRTSFLDMDDVEQVQKPKARQSRRVELDA